MPKTANSNKSTDLPVVQQRGKPSQKAGRGRLRAAVLIGVHLLIFAHIAHYFWAKRSLSPVEPSESMFTIELGHLNAGAIFFGLAIVSTVMFGRFFCGWGCHIVALQDLCGYLLKRVGLRPKPLRSRLLKVVPFVLAFYMFLWPTVQRIWQGRPHPGFSNHLMTENFWQTFPGPAVAILTFLVCGGLIVYLLGNKGFCTYGCPYGAFFSVADRLAFGRIRVTDACHQCGQCTAHCTSNVKVHAEVRDFGMVVDPGCMKCMDCVSVCPNEALYFGLWDKSGSRGVADQKKVSPPPARSKFYDFSLTEEVFGLVVAAATVFALRGLYDITPLLLSVGLASITAYLAIQSLRVLRKRDIRIQNFQVKRANRITRSGIWVIALLVGWFLFNIHSFAVQYHRYRGRNHLARVNAGWEELLAGKTKERLSAEDIGNLETAERSLGISDQLGLIDTMEVKLGRAAVSLINANQEDAEQFLRAAYACRPEFVGELLAEFLAAQGRTDEAMQILGYKGA